MRPIVRRGICLAPYKWQRPRLTETGGAVDARGVPVLGGPMSDVTSIVATRHRIAPVPLSPPGSVARAIQRRNAAIGALAALSPSVLSRLWQTDPVAILELDGLLAEAAGSALLACRAARARPISLPRGVASSNGSGRDSAGV